MSSPIIQEQIANGQNVGGNDQVIKECERKECGCAELNNDHGRDSKSGNDDQSKENEPKNVFSSLQSSNPSRITQSMKCWDVILLSVSSQNLFIRSKMGRYIEMTIAPTIKPTKISNTGSNMESRLATEYSTSSS